MDYVTIGSSFFAALVAKGITAPANTLNDLWNGILGHAVHSWSEKRKKYYEEFKKETEEKINKLPIDNFQEPKISILGPALEASKYYYEEDEIRNLFSNLIVSSMNSEKKHYMHNSFVEIIKQMSPHDANLLKNIMNENTVPIVSLIKYTTNPNTFVVLRDIVYFNDIFNDINENEISIVNLIRLGLLEVDYQSYITNKERYNIYNIFGELEDESTNIILGNRYCKKNVLKITALGNCFINVCIGS